MINLLIDNTMMVQVKSYGEAYHLIKSVEDELGEKMNGSLKFESDPEDNELYLSYNSK